MTTAARPGRSGTARNAVGTRLDRPVRRLVEDSLHFPRADPAELARFDVRTKRCTMNCGPHREDPRSDAERKLLCGDCLTMERTDMDEQCKHGIRAPHECRECADELSAAIIALQRIHDFADAAHTRDDGHCYALSEIVALCRAALHAAA